MKINVLAAIVLVPAAALFAQEFRGAFSGGVTDPQGADIAKAKIVATEIRTARSQGRFPGTRARTRFRSWRRDSSGLYGKG